MSTPFVFIAFMVVFIFYQNLSNAQPKYTDGEMIAIEEFRELVKNDLYMDYMKSDTYLIKWLRAKNFNQKDANNMLLTALKWRKEHKVDTILTEKLDDPRNRIFYTDSTDYNGSLVATSFVSRFDTRGIVLSGKRYNIGIRVWIQFWETILQNIMKRVGAVGNNTMEGTATDLVTFIVDMGGYNLRQHACLSCFSVFSEWYQIFENYYPGFVKHMFYINAPRIFEPLLEVLKPIMSEQTRKAVRSLGPNKKEWHEVIDKIVPINEQRVEIGGTKSK